MERKGQSIYARGAVDGLWMGLLVTAMFGCMVWSMSIPLAALAAIGLMIAVPFVLYRFLRSSFTESRGMLTFSALWMQGIMTFAAASVIFGFCTYVYLRWLDAGFIRGVIEVAADYYTSLPDPDGRFDEISSQLNAMIERNILPQASSMVMAWMWLMVFSGSLLSMLVAAMARRRGTKNAFD